MKASEEPRPEGALAVSSASQPLRNPHFPCFDAMRGLGVVLILATHVHFQTIATKKGVFSPILWHMDVGLTIFFMLSGFLLFRPFVLGSFAGRSPGSTALFLRRRFLRVIPGYWFALTAVVIFFGLKLRSVGDAVFYYGLLPPLTNSRAFNTSPIRQEWSLTVEVMFYLLLPVYALVIRRLGKHRELAGRVRIALIGSAVLFAIGTGFRAYFSLAHPSWQAQGALVLPAWIDILAIGMAMAALSAAHQLGRPLPRPLVALGDRPGLAWGIAGVLFLAISRVASPAKPYVFNGEYVLRYFAYGIIGLLLLAPAMFGDQTKGRLRAVLRHPVLVYVGTVSLGIYLIHLAILDKLYAHLYPHGNTIYGGRGNFFVLYFGTLALCLVFASLSYYVVERHFLRLKNPRTRAAAGADR